MGTDAGTSLKRVSQSRVPAAASNALSDQGLLLDDKVASFKLT